MPNLIDTAADIRLRRTRANIASVRSRTEPSGTPPPADIKSQKIALIKDVNGERQTADYKIVVMHTDSGARTETVACDPRIVNN